MTLKTLNFWPPVIVLALLQFTHILDFVVIMPLGPQLMRELSLTTAQFGMVVSSYTLSAAIAGVLGAFMIDKFDRKKSLLISYLGFAIGTLLCGLSSGYLGLLFARMVTGAFGGVCTSVLMAIIGDIVPEEKRGTAMGLIMSSFSLASIIGIPIGLYVAYLWGWHIPFIALGFISLFIIGFIVAFIPSIKDHIVAIKTTRRHHELRDILLNPAHIKAYLYSVSLIFSGFLIFPFMSPFMVSNMGLPERHLATIYLVGGVATLLTTFLIGMLSDRFGKHFMFTLLALSSIAPILWVTQATLSPLFLSLIISTVFMVLMSGRMIPAMAMLTLVPSDEHRGGFMSIHSAIQQLAMSGASFMAGLLIAEGVNGKMLHFDRVGWIATFFVVLSLLLSRKLVFLQKK